MSSRPAWATRDTVLKNKIKLEIGTLCRSGCPGIPDIDEAGLELTCLGLPSAGVKGVGPYTNFIVIRRK